MASTITICQQVFKKKADAEKFLRDKMWSYELGIPVPPQDEPIWLDVLRRHEWLHEYLEFGVAHFSVARSEQRPNLRNMVVVNEQGDHKPFSYKKYLSERPLPKLAKVLAA